MHTLWQDMRYALRLLTKNPGFGAIAVLSLALGIGANTTIFTVINAILLHPLPVKDISRVVQVDTIDTKTRVTAANATKLGMSFPNYQDYARDNQVFTALGCTVGPLPLTWSGGAEPKQIFGQLVSANYFDILGMRPAAGRFFLPDEDTKLGGNDVAVLSYSLWANKFGSDPSRGRQSSHAQRHSLHRNWRGTSRLQGRVHVWECRADLDSRQYVSSGARGFLQRQL